MKISALLRCQSKKLFAPSAPLREVLSAHLKSPLPSMREAMAILILAIGLSACSGDGVSSRVRDRKAYNLGREHAERAVELRADESGLQEYLLDVRARVNNIGARIGRQAAADYERGFIDGVTASSDSLARILF